MPGKTSVLGLVLLAAYTSRTPLGDPDATSSGEDASAGDLDTAAPPTTGATSSGPTDAAPTSSGPGETTSTTGTDATTEHPSSTGGADDRTTGSPTLACASRCDRTSVHDGDVIVMAGDSTAWLACVTHVTGDVTLFGDIEPSALMGLADLQQVDGKLSVTHNDLLTDLDVFGCLRAVDELTLDDLPGVTDLSPLAALEQVGSFSVVRTGVTTLADLPPLTGVREIGLIRNDGLVDLEGLESWQVTPDALGVYIKDCAGLTSVAALEPLLAQAAAAGPLLVELAKLPQLTSLAGLEPMTHGQLSLSYMPLVADLEPLAQLEQAERLALGNLPQLGSLHGLHNLKTVTTSLEIGECGALSDGLDGLTSLAGLDSLTAVGTLTLAGNDALTELDGAPQLEQLATLRVFDNPLLPNAAIDALLAQLAAPPADECVGASECNCLPPP